jgi:hypothetical protein
MSCSPAGFLVYWSGTDYVETCYDYERNGERGHALSPLGRAGDGMINNSVATTPYN